MLIDKGFTQRALRSRVRRDTSVSSAPLRPLREIQVSSIRYQPLLQLYFSKTGKIKSCKLSDVLA